MLKLIIVWMLIVVYVLLALIMLAVRDVRPSVRVIGTILYTTTILVLFTDTGVAL